MTAKFHSNLEQVYSAYASWDISRGKQKTIDMVAYSTILNPVSVA
jgi:hypothetical protein